MRRIIAVFACFILCFSSVKADGLSDLSIPELLDLQQAIVDELKSRLNDEVPPTYPLGYEIPDGIEISTSIPNIIFESEKTVVEMEFTHYLLTASFIEFSNLSGYLFQTEHGIVSINPSAIVNDPTNKSMPDAGLTVQMICTYLGTYRGIPYFEYGIIDP